MKSLARLSKSLKLNDDGIWRSKSSTEINYPKNGNEFCFEMEDRSYWFEHRNNCILSIIQRYPPSGPILDVGGGNGFVAQQLQREGLAVSLLEPGSLGANNARKNRQINEVINSTFEAANFPNESLSAVGLFDVLEHIEEDGLFLKNVWLTLKPGGYLYATVPAFNFLWSASDNYAEHCRRYSKKMITKLIGTSFSLRYFSYFFSSLFVPILFLRTIPYWLWKKNDGSLLSSDKEFGLDESFFVDLLKWFLGYELKYIKSGKTLPIGSSCLLVLEKNVL